MHTAATAKAARSAGITGKSRKSRVKRPLNYESNSVQRKQAKQHFTPTGHSQVYTTTLARISLHIQVFYRCIVTLCFIALERMYH
jgi:hypothetical protein